ncbi:MAG: hypothetical protein ABI543_12515 [Ignavibacteria bacterium]
MKEFEKFITSPFFNNGRNYLPLYKTLKYYYPAFDNPKLTEEKIFNRLYPGIDFNTGNTSTLRSMISRMCGLAEKFMVYNEFESGKFQYTYNLLLADLYRNKKFYGSALKVLLQNSTKIDNDDDKEKFVYRRLETNKLLSDIFIQQDKPNEDYKYSSKNILYIYTYIFETLSSFHNKIRVSNRNYNIIYKGYDLVMHFVKTFDPILFDKECPEDNYATKELVLVNYYLLKSLLDENDNESILYSIDLYIRIFDKLSHFKQFSLFSLLFNRCIGKYRFDKLYLQKGNELIDYVWGKGVFSYSVQSPILLIQYLSALHFKLALSKTIELRRFISKYAGEVSQEFKEDIKKYSYACLYFKEKSYKKCLEQISQKDSLPVTININVSKFKICCLYELTYLENTLSAIDSFDHFLRKNKSVSEIIKTENFKFVKGIRKLIKLKLGNLEAHNFDSDEISELTKNLILGYWFKEKLEELIQKGAN